MQKTAAAAEAVIRPLLKGKSAVVTGSSKPRSTAGSPNRAGLDAVAGVVGLSAESELLTKAGELWAGL